MAATQVAVMKWNMHMMWISLLQVEAGGALFIFTIHFAHYNFAAA